VEAYLADHPTLETGRPLNRLWAMEPRWTLAFVGVLSYLVVDYTRLPAMFPFLQVLQLGKVVIIVSVLGVVLEPRAFVAVPRAVSWIKGCLVAILLVGLMSALLTKYSTHAWDGIRDAGLYLLVAYLVGRIVNTRWRVKIFYWLYILLNFKLAQFVIRSYFWQRGQGVSATLLAKGVGAGSTGFFSNSADLGVAMCVAWALTIPLLFASLGKITRLFLVGSSLIFLVSILYCGSRGALLGATAVAAAALLRSPKKLVPAFMAAAFLMGLLFVLPKASWVRVHSAENWRNDPNAQSRIAFWIAGLHMLRDHPLIGVGVGDFPSAYSRDYVDPAITTRAYACHSIYIQALSELGILGTFPIVALCCLVFWLNAQTSQSALEAGGRRSFEGCLALGLNLALVGYLVSGAFLAVLFYPMLWNLAGLSMGLSVACARKKAARGVSSQGSGVDIEADQVHEEES
jgi:O-antigen ligase